ncbi:ABC transporter ATP-binding protein [Gulosibacter chungangensis]|uniref:ABC transporter ATP-binding protein n=1 Tax=Gulosibacter chungangensis TaxID=979746 RepID=A0A7J5BB27_9MICO|nr:ABC transporter ATP-binding protein [Gulosibacter chungangensis]KAB1643234.1 ABC transporter ATP-binding protein [Gulosibacter chungangensis]
MSDTGLPIASGRTSMRFAWRLSRGHRAKLLLVAVLGIGSAAAGLVSPAVIGVLVDAVQSGTADGRLVLWSLGLMVAAAVLGAIGTGVTVVLAARTYHAMLAQLREELVATAMHLPQGMVERAGTGDLISRSSDDVSEIADAAPAIIPAFTMTGFTIAVSLIGMTAVDWWFGLALIILLPIYVLTVRWYLRTAPQIYQAERAAMSDRAQQLMESQRGFDTITGFQLGQQRHQRVLTASWSVVGHSLRASTVQNMFFGRLNLAEFVGLAAILLTGFIALRTGQSTVGGATTAALLFMRLFGPINQFLMVFDTLQSVAASLNRMIGVVSADGPARSQVARSSTESAHVHVENVHFHYDEQSPALRDIGLSIQPGESLAVVGASGAGKTTLAAVIAGIHSPTSGTVTRPERTVVISQETHVFAGSVADNLRLVKVEATDKELCEALETVHALSLVRTLPDGLETRVGQGGTPLTSAQAQQLALARLVLANPDLAVLDEATAEAESAESGLLDRAARAAISGRASLIVAHRLSQAASCDHILVLDSGVVVEQGNHADLLAADGRYARLWEAWSRGRVSPNSDS